MAFEKDPLAMIFVNPFSDKKLLGDYQSKIRNFVQVDLATVRKRIKEDHYSSLKAWSDDMYLIFNNAIQYNGPESAVGGIATYLLRKLDKKMEFLEARNLRNYEEQLMSLGRDLQAILRKPPPAFGFEVPPEGVRRDEPFTIERIESLKASLASFARDGGEDKIRSLLETMESDPIRSVVDLGRLGRRSLVALEDLVKKE